MSFWNWLAFGLVSLLLNLSINGRNLRVFPNNFQAILPGKIKFTPFEIFENFGNRIKISLLVYTPAQNHNPVLQATCFALVDFHG